MCPSKMFPACSLRTHSAFRFSGKLCDRIVWHLKQVTPDPIDTLAIAKNVLGDKATKKHVNPTLYELEKMGVIQRSAAGCNRPRWILAGNAYNVCAGEGE